MPGLRHPNRTQGRTPDYTRVQTPKDPSIEGSWWKLKSGTAPAL